MRCCDDRRGRAQARAPAAGRRLRRLATSDVSAAFASCSARAKSGARASCWSRTRTSASAPVPWTGAECGSRCRPSATLRALEYWQANAGTPLDGIVLRRMLRVDVLGLRLGPDRRRRRPARAAEPRQWDGVLRRDRREPARFAARVRVPEARAADVRGDAGGRARFAARRRGARVSARARCRSRARSVTLTTQRACVRYSSSSRRLRSLAPILDILIELCVLTSDRVLGLEIGDRQLGPIERLLGADCIARDPAPRRRRRLLTRPSGRRRASRSPARARNDDAPGRGWRKRRLVPGRARALARPRVSR